VSSGLWPVDGWQVDWQQENGPSSHRSNAPEIMIPAAAGPEENAQTRARVTKKRPGFIALSAAQSAANSVYFHFQAPE
jgi:hypothetical protein